EIYCIEAFWTRFLIDPVGAKLPFLGSAWPVSILTLIYLLIVLKYGKEYMKNRKPYDITNILIGYNLFQVIYNGLMFSFISYYYLKTYNLSCIPTLPLDHPDKNIERMLSYVYFINKIIDLLDTIFFVLRKSYKQITVLHVYHHVLMTCVPFWIVRFYGVGGQFATMALLNTFVHTVMYFYYMISAIYPGLKGSLWWKKYITIIQILQFFSVMLQSVYILIFNPTCKYPIVFHYMIIILGIVFVAFFTNFYIQAYIIPQRVKQKGDL
ncbi:hypothetical protein KR044_001653, partial [Drosophila immigrans]